MAPDTDLDESNTSPIRDAHRRLIELVREKEWITDSRESHSYCIYCYAAEYDGHRDDCEIFGTSGIARMENDDR